MPRFTILEHDFPRQHWDLLLDTGDSRVPTWRVEWGAEQVESGRQRADGAAVTLPAEQLADHRREYLDYEGPVSGDRGSVRQWDTGLYVLLGRAEDCWEMRWEGTRISGFVSLFRTPGQAPQFWTLKLSLESI